MSVLEHGAIKRDKKEESKESAVVLYQSTLNFAKYWQSYRATEMDLYSMVSKVAGSATVECWRRFNGA